MERLVQWRYLITRIDPTVLRKFDEIVDTYFRLHDGADLRIRVTNNDAAVMTVRRGVGPERSNSSEHMGSVADARALIRKNGAMRKRRYTIGKWVVDCFEGLLDGLMIAEYKADLGEHEEPARPSWLEGRNVTNTLTNQHVFELLKRIQRSGTERAPRDLLEHNVPTIVMTGGPCSGKTSVMRHLLEKRSDTFHCVPEVATIVIAQLKVLPEMSDRFAAATFQRTIYDVQSAFERVSHEYAARCEKRALLLDRGTVDGAAYLDGGTEELAKVCGTDLGTEYAKYGLVLYLAPPSPEIYELNMANNAARSETYEQAVELGRRIENVWIGHPNFRHIPSFQTWEEKLNAITSAIESYLARSR